ncbi:MAG: hypothetical protein WCR58_09660 [Bacteroidales bacterium]|jgi:hypothetical protein|nr:hypothetical protein [Bacteroidales bacterium]MCK9449184.1 hypothetical protein [Bacteroidales bacterium]MDD3701778.1 hypothetical protein [Bacteroidales bacterium]MDY0370159.1 hypothetical protein [Bacteroidales bacterium]
MKPVKKKTRPQQFSDNDDFIRKPLKKATPKRDRKPSIYQPIDDEEEDLDLDLFNFDDDFSDEEDDDF